ncbi:MAG TPA: IclR family transcriptional regulator [Actinomycetota bacterium]|nr:IclR family transcriptional regulator [Actinomycetota bacterium]
MVSTTKAATERARSAPVADAAPFRVLDRTFSILELFDEDHTDWNASEVARAVGLPVPTAHRILTALKHRGYVSQDDSSKRFRLGLSSMRLGDRARSVVDLRTVALPVLQRLAEHAGETALLTVVSQDHASGSCLERVESSQPLRLSVSPGRQLPLHAGASQKALLAFMSSRAIDANLGAKLERLCDATITDPAAMRAELARIRRRGWAGSFEETNVGVWGVAVPVLGDDGVVICAVGVAGPSARLSASSVRTDIERVHAAALEIAAPLGLRVPPLRDTRARVDSRRRGKP